MEVVAPEAGRLDRIHVSEGSTIESEALLAEITPGEGEAAAPTPEASDAGQPTSTDAPMGPAARQLVEEHGLNPSAISGSGKGGRINKEDVLQHLAQKASAPAPAPAPAPLAPSAQVAPATSTDVQGPTSERIERRVPMTRMRARLSGFSLRRSKQQC